MNETQELKPGSENSSLQEIWHNLTERLAHGDIGSLPVLLGLILIAIVFQFANPNFLSPLNLTNLMVQISAVGTISVGVVLVLLIGEIDLSVGAVSGLSRRHNGGAFGQNGLAGDRSDYRRNPGRRRHRLAARLVVRQGARAVFRRHAGRFFGLARGAAVRLGKHRHDQPERSIDHRAGKHPPAGLDRLGIGLFVHGDICLQPAPRAAYARQDRPAGHEPTIVAGVTRCVSWQF